jgi:hypothetical protein
MPRLHFNNRSFAGRPGDELGSRAPDMELTVESSHFVSLGHDTALPQASSHFPIESATKSLLDDCSSDRKRECARFVV